MCELFMPPPQSALEKQISLTYLESFFDMLFAHFTVMRQASARRLTVSAGTKRQLPTANSQMLSPNA